MTLSLNIDLNGYWIGRRLAEDGDGELFAEIVAGLADHSCDAVFAFAVAREISEEHLGFLKALVAAIDAKWLENAAQDAEARDAGKAGA